MKRIYVCMGSACHLKGGEKVVKVFLEQIKRYNLSDKVEIKGSFCLGPCAQAVAVKVDDKVITNVSPENATEVFRTKILPIINEKGEGKT